MCTWPLKTSTKIKIPKRQTCYNKQLCDRVFVMENAQGEKQNSKLSGFYRLARADYAHVFPTPSSVTSR